MEVIRTFRAAAVYAAVAVCASFGCTHAETAPLRPSPSPGIDRNYFMDFLKAAAAQGHDRRIRIVSLAPSLTEIAYALHCDDELVGDTTFDDYPPAAKKLPHIADLSHVDLEALAKLRPTVALALHDQEKEGSEIAERLRVPVTYLPNRGIDDIYADIAGLGKACVTTLHPDEHTTMVRTGIRSLAAKAAHEPTKPRVLFLLGLPGFTAGKSSYLDDLIRVAGGVNVAGNVDQPYPDLSDEAIVAMQPDVIVVGREVPFGQDVRSREPWRSLAAVRTGRIEVSPNDDLLERPGPRIVEGLSWLEKAIH
ncbi:MAG: ABC transporter substrate-binding protein [Candidatus Eremiobacterales bacterium]